MSVINNPISSRPPDNLALFPLCDTRGWITSVLCNRATAAGYKGHRPDALFFAWLLDLPISVTPAAAARSLLTVAGLDTAPVQTEPGIRGELHKLLADIAQPAGTAVTRRTLKRPQKSPL